MLLKDAIPTLSLLKYSLKLNQSSLACIRYVHAKHVQFHTIHMVSSLLTCCASMLLT